MPNDYSVVIPAYNAERFIAAAIDSVLAQSVAPATVIVVDDGSTDRTRDILRSFGKRIRVLHQANSGQGAATSAGVACVETSLVAFLDADDLWLPGKMEAQCRRLEEASTIEVLFAHAQLMYEEQETGKVLDQPVWGRTTMLARSASFRRVGAVHDMRALRGDMIDWIDRARGLGLGIEMMGAVLAVRRVHKDSLTYRRGDGDRGYLAAVKLALDRRRAKSSGVDDA